MKQRDLFGAYARGGDPHTRHDAASSLSSDAVSHCETVVWQALKARGTHGATWDELHDLTGMDKATISPRFKPLREKGLIRRQVIYDGDGKTPLVGASGRPRYQTRPGKSGKAQIVWYAVT